MSFLWQERRGCAHRGAGQPLTGGSPHSRQGGTAGMGRWEQQDRPQGAAPSLELIPIPVAGSWSCCPPKSSSILLHLHLRGAFPKAWRGVPVTSLAASWCPRRAPPAAPASVCPSPLHPVHSHPISPSGTRCHLVAASTPSPAPAASHPHPFHHDLVLGYFGKHRGSPPSSRPPPVHPLGAALGGPEPPREVAVVQSRPQNGIDGSETPRR